MPAHGIFVDPAVAERAGVSLDAIARYLNAYTIEMNWTASELPPGYEDRADEPVFEAAFPTEILDRVMDCAGASTSP